MKLSETKATATNCSQAFLHSLPSSLLGQTVILYHHWPSRMHGGGMLTVCGNWSHCVWCVFIPTSAPLLPASQTPPTRINSLTADNLKLEFNLVSLAIRRKLNPQIISLSLYALSHQFLASTYMCPYIHAHPTHAYTYLL